MQTYNFYPLGLVFYMRYLTFKMLENIGAQNEARHNAYCGGLQGLCIAAGFQPTINEIVDIVRNSNV